MANYYKVLGVPETASTQEIRKAYKKKALETHPDRHAKEINSDPSKKEYFDKQFKKVTTAHEILSDPDKRKIYDAARLAKPKVETQAEAHTTPTYQAKPRADFNPAAHSQEQAQAKTSPNSGFFGQSTSAPSFTPRERNPEPRSYAAFFEQEEDVFYPENVADRDPFVAFTTPSINEIFNCLFAAINQVREESIRQHQRQHEQRFANFAKEKQQPTPRYQSHQVETEESKQSSYQDDCFLERRRAERRPGITITYVVFSAPSPVFMADFFLQTILLQSLIINVANFNHSNHLQQANSHSFRGSASFNANHEAEREEPAPAHRFGR